MSACKPLLTGCYFGAYSAEWRWSLKHNTYNQSRDIPGMSYSSISLKNTLHIHREISEL